MPVNRRPGRLAYHDATARQGRSRYCQDTRKPVEAMGASPYLLVKTLRDLGKPCS